MRQGGTRKAQSEQGEPKIRDTEEDADVEEEEGDGGKGASFVACETVPDPVLKSELCWTDSLSVLVVVVLSRPLALNDSTETCVTKSSPSLAVEVTTDRTSAGLVEWWNVSEDVGSWLSTVISPLLAVEDTSAEKDDASPRGTTLGFRVLSSSLAI